MIDIKHNSHMWREKKNQNIQHITCLCNCASFFDLLPTLFTFEIKMQQKWKTRNLDIAFRK